MGVSKGISPAQVIEIIESLISLGLNPLSEDFKGKVISAYNDIFSKTSKDTIIANIREDAMVKFQEDRVIVKLPQDNKKVDLMAVKIVDNIVDIRVIQQKGNNASFNSTSLSKTLDCLDDFIKNGEITNYFHLLPDNLNPTKNGLQYKVDVVIGMLLACGNGVKGGIKVITNNDYLRYLGILSKSICDIDYWVYNQYKLRNHNYNAIDKCGNFNTIYDECINIFLNYGNQ